MIKEIVLYQLQNSWGISLSMEHIKAAHTPYTGSQKLSCLCSKNSVKTSAPVLKEQAHTIYSAYIIGDLSNTSRRQYKQIM